MEGEIDVQEAFIQDGINIANKAMHNFQAEIKRMQSQTIKITMVAPGYEQEPNTIEGSVVHPIDKPGQLIEGPDAK